MSGGPWEDFAPAAGPSGPWEDFKKEATPGVTPAPANAKPREYAPTEPSADTPPNFFGRTSARISAAERGQPPLPSHTSPTIDTSQASRFASRALSLQPIRAAVQLPEFATTEMVGMAGNVTATATAKIWAMLNGYSREGADTFAEGVGAEHNETAAAAYRPLTTLINALAGKSDEPTTLDRLMGKVTEVIKGGAESVSKATGGLITPGEGQLLVNAAFAALGAKGLNRMTARWDGNGPMPKEFAKKFEEAMAAQGKPPTNLRKASASDIAAAFEKEAPVEVSAEAPFKKKYPTLKKAGMVDEFGKPLAAAAGVGVAAYALSGGDQDATSLAAMAVIPFAKKIDAVKAAVPEAFHRGLDEIVISGPSSIHKLDTLRMELSERGVPKEVLETLDSAARDLEVMQEPHGAPLIWFGNGPEVFLYAARNKDSDAVKAMGFLTIGALAKLPDATPFGAIHGRLRYTSRFLERLNERSAGTWDFSVKQLRQELGKSGAPAAERAIFEKIIEGRERVTAKELVGGFKAATGDFELTAQRTDQYAPYGLERIDRIRPYEDPGAMPGEDALIYEGTNAPEARTLIWQSPIATGAANHFSDPNYFAHTRSFDEGGVRHVVEVQSDLVQKAGKVLTEEERAGLERQLDTTKVQRQYILERIEALKAAGAAKLDELQSRGLDASSVEWQSWLYERNRTMRSLRDEQLRLETQRSELTSKLDGSGTAERVAPLRPLFPDWYKRVVREEVVDATRERQANYKRLRDELRSGESDFDRTRAAIEKEEDQAFTGSRIMRFATADTVAKVEGWPGVTERLMRDARQHLSEAEARLRQATAQLRVNPEGSFLQEQYAEAVRLRDSAFENYQKSLDASGPTFSPEHQLIYDRYKGGIERFLKSEFRAREVADAHGHTWLEIDLPTKEPSTRLFGVAAAGAVGAGLLATWLNGGDESKEALAALAVAPVAAKSRAARVIPAALAIGAGAAVTAALSSPENRARNAAFATAVLGLATFAKSHSSRVARWASESGQAAEVVYGNLSAELRAMSPPLLRRLTGHELDLKVREHDALKRITPFAEGVLKLPANVREAIDIALMSGRRDTALAIAEAAGDAKLPEALRSAFSYIDEVGGELKSLGLVKRLNPGHFPRIVTDLDGLMAYLGKEGGSFLADRLKEAANKKVKKTGAPLNDIEMSAVVNEHLLRALNLSDLGGQSGILKTRTIRQMREGLLPFYATAGDSIVIYARAASREIERANFFGTNLVKAKDTLAVNLDRSIGKVVDAERRAGNLSHEQLNRLESLLRARFGPGERSGHWLTQTYRNVVQTLLLGNPFSAIVQFGDAAVAVAIHGLLPTIRSVASVSLGKAVWKLEDFGLVNHITEDLVRTTRRDTLRVGRAELTSAKFLEGALKLSGFSFVDEFSKLVNMNAAATRFGKLARSEKGVKEISLRYGDYFGGDLAQLIADLRAGKKTPLVGELIFRELSDVQPISKLEMPQGYLASPHTRVLYTLKSFMIKQMNLVRERGFREIAKGDAASIARGTNFLLRYSLALGLSGASLTVISNWLMGKTSELEASDVIENVFKSFGWGSYAVDKARKGHAVEAAVESNLPPYKLFDDIASTPDELRKWAAGDPKANPKGVQYIPIVGKVIYNRALGGAERADKREQLLKRLREREAEKAK